MGEWLLIAQNSSFELRFSAGGPLEPEGGSPACCQGRGLEGPLRPGAVATSPKGCDAHVTGDVTTFLSPCWRIRPSAILSDTSVPSGQHLANGHAPPQSHISAAATSGVKLSCRSRRAHSRAVSGVWGGCPHRGCREDLGQEETSTH